MLEPYLKDHTEFETGENVYMGLDGFYLLSDDEERALNLPKGKYDIGSCWRLG